MKASAKFRLRGPAKRVRVDEVMFALLGGKSTLLMLERVRLGSGKTMQHECTLPVNGQVPNVRARGPECPYEEDAASAGTIRMDRRPWHFGLLGPARRSDRHPDDAAAHGLSRTAGSLQRLLDDGVPGDCGLSAVRDRH